MPIYHHFYVESRTPEGWGVPLNFEPDDSAFSCDWRFGAFAFAHPMREWLELFFDADALS